MRDAIFAAAAQAALGPRKEPGGLLPGRDDRPADVLLPYWTQGKDTALDITVVNPLQGALIQQVAVDGESGVRHAYNAKMAKYDDRCSAEGIAFVPMAVDTFKGWHGAALDVLQKLGRQVARQVGKEEEDGSFGKGSQFSLPGTMLPCSAVERLIFPPLLLMVM